MAGISSKALNFGSPENKKKYNGIEYDSTFGIDENEAQLRNLDPQVGRWWEIDPKVEDMEMWSPYASNYDNPILYSDPLGDEGENCCGILQAVRNVLIAASGVVNGALNTATMGVYPSDPFSLRPRLDDDERQLYDKSVSVGQIGPVIMPGGKTVERPAPGGFKPITEPIGGKTEVPTSNRVQSNSNKTTSTDATSPKTDNKTVSPNVQKALNTLKEIKAEGGTVKVNPTKPNQEVNMTVQKGTQKLDIRVETHPVPPKYGGNGVTPQRHLNVDLYPNKNVLPNNGHKILE